MWREIEHLKIKTYAQQQQKKLKKMKIKKFISKYNNQARWNKINMHENATTNAATGISWQSHGLRKLLVAHTHTRTYQSHSAPHCAAAKKLCCCYRVQRSFEKLPKNRQHCLSGGVATIGVAAFDGATLLPPPLFQTHQRVCMRCLRCWH